MRIGSFTLFILSGTVITIGLIAFLLWGAPQYNVWSKGMGGKALLMEAESTRQVRVTEARAKLEASKLEADAEVTRAKGQALANIEISKTLTPEVLQYQYIRVLEEQGQQGDRTVIYIPTDSRTGLPMSLPAPEAQRLGQK